MIAKQVKGRGFRGTLNYLLKKPEAQVIGGNMLGETPRELASEFAESRKLRPGLEKAVYHASLSLAPGENFSDEKWRSVTERYTKEMGFEGSQYVVVRHKDTEHDHVHIVASRIRMDGSAVSDSQDYKRSEKVVRSLEIEHGLTRVPNSNEVLRRAPTSDELRKVARTNVPSHRMQLQGLVDSAMKGNPDVADFFSRLESMGVSPIPNVAKTGHVSGISYRLDGEVMKGSDLGRGYSWQGIQKRGVSYGRENNDRDSKAINRRLESEKNRVEGLESSRRGDPSPERRASVLPDKKGRGLGEEISSHRRSDVGARPSKQADANRNEGHGPNVKRGIGESLERIAARSGVPQRRSSSHDVADMGSGPLGRHLKRPNYGEHLQSLAEILRDGKSRKQLEKEQQIEQQKIQREEQWRREREEREKKRKERAKSRGRDDGRGGGLGL